jgi:hypothetical protein
LRRINLSMGWGRVLRAAGWAIRCCGDQRETVPGREAVGAAIVRARVERGEHAVVAVVAQLGACEPNASVLGDPARVTPESLLAGRALSAARLFWECPKVERAIIRFGIAVSLGIAPSDVHYTVLAGRRCVNRSWEV